jgi:hypothetical protein
MPMLTVKDQTSPEMQMISKKSESGQDRVAPSGEQPGKHIEDARNDPLVQDGARLGRNRAPLVGPDSVAGTPQSATGDAAHDALGPDRLDILKRIDRGERVVGDEATWAVIQDYAQQAEDSDIGLTDKGRQVLDDRR